MVFRTCVQCESIKTCTTCGEPIQTFNHVGVRGVKSKQSSGIWHLASPCGHKVKLAAPIRPGSTLAVYNGGPLWQNGYQFVDVFWGSFWITHPSTGIGINKAVQDITSDSDFWGGLVEYNIGTNPPPVQTVVLNMDPPSTIDDSQIQARLQEWIAKGTLPDLLGKGAYNIFFPPGVTVTLQGVSSCVDFCDYHNAVSETGPFYTVEPYPCSAGCNQCTGSEFDTLTQGLSEEMVELATDMNPGTGWVIGNLELCDECDISFVCNQIISGEYVNAWYSNVLGKCWGKATSPPAPGTQCAGYFEQAASDFEAGNYSQSLVDALNGLECILQAGVLDSSKEAREIFKRLIKHL